MHERVGSGRPVPEISVRIVHVSVAANAGADDTAEEWIVRLQQQVRSPDNVSGPSWFGFLRKPRLLGEVKEATPLGSFPRG